MESIEANYDEEKHQVVFTYNEHRSCLNAEKIIISTAGRGCTDEDRQVLRNFARSLQENMNQEIMDRDIEDAAKWFRRLFALMYLLIPSSLIPLSLLIYLGDSPTIVTSSQYATESD